MTSTHKKMIRNVLIAIVATAFCIGVILLTPGQSNGPKQGVPGLKGTRRTHLQQADLSAPGREVVQVRVDIDPGVTAARHSHPGEEIVYAIEGEMEYLIDGREPVTIKAGEVLFIPAGAVHAVKNVGRGNAAELATYIVEKGKPLVVPAK